MKRIFKLILLGLGLSASQISPLLSREQIPVAPDSAFRSKYHHREMGGIALGEDFSIALTSRGWMVKADQKGEVLWRISAGCNPVTGPVLDDTNLYYACAQGLLVARELKTGKELWRFSYRSSVSSKPVVSEDLIVFQTGTGTIYCLNKSDGSLNWLSRQAMRGDLSMLGASQPMIIGDRVYLGLGEGFLAELGLEDGSLVWKKRIFKREIVSDLDYELLTDIDSIYASSLEGICAVSKNTGKVFWCVNQELAGDSAQDQNFVYSLTRDRTILVIDKITGLIEEKIELKKPALEKWEPERLVEIKKNESRLILVLSKSVWEWSEDKKEPRQIIRFSENTIKRAEIQGDRLYLLNSKGYLAFKELK